MSGPQATLHSDDPQLLDFAELVGTDDPVAVEGSRTAWQVGGQVAPSARLISAPTGIVEYKPEEMTVRVRAGTSVGDLQMALAERGQRTALPDRGGTIGGALVVGHNDHRALGRGTVRSSVLQVRYVSAEGRIINSGGPTVKNVSGFDLPRLMVGSLGTLGLLAEVILRTNPIPPVSRWIALDGADPRAAARTALQPSAVLWDGATTWVQLEGHEPDVEAEHQALRALGPSREVPTGPPLGSHRWSLAPAALPALATPEGPDTGEFVAAIGLGLVYAERPQPVRRLDPGLAIIAERLKHNFDPTGRLNPGRQPGAA